MKPSLFISHSAEETRKYAHRFAETIFGGTIVCLSGNLGSGKTTFAQGILQAFHAEKPYTSPTFLIMKEYILSSVYIKDRVSKSQSPVRRIIHIDAYRISDKDMLNIGWHEISEDKETLILIEWPEKIQAILPGSAQKIQFEWTEENTRTITVCSSPANE